MSTERDREREEKQRRERERESERERDRERERERGREREREREIGTKLLIDRRTRAREAHAGEASAREPSQLHGFAIPPPGSQEKSELGSNAHNGLGMELLLDRWLHAREAHAGERLLQGRLYNCMASPFRRLVVKSLRLTYTTHLATYSSHVSLQWSHVLCDAQSR